MTHSSQRGSKESTNRPYQSPGHCIRFPDDENETLAISVLRDTPEAYCSVAPDLYLFTNKQVADLQQAGVTFEYVSEPPTLQEKKE